MSAVNRGVSWRSEAFLRLKVDQDLSFESIMENLTPI